MSPVSTSRTPRASTTSSSRSTPPRQASRQSSSTASPHGRTRDVSPQIGGVAFAWNPALASGNRIVTLSLSGGDGKLTAPLCKDGAPVASAPETITVVTRNFIANNVDAYLVNANGANFRYLLADNTLGSAPNEANDFTIAPSLPANPIGEQQDFDDYLAARHATPATAYTLGYG
jgi:hypothetical protein